MPKVKEEEEDIMSDNGEEDTDDEGEEFYDEDEDDDDDFLDMGSVLSSLLTTEEGDNVCTALVKINNTLQKQMETQNKILLKILTVMNKKGIGEKES